ncbi:MAG: hypothetical protein R3B70_28600 [Polyangiaceae bacterium]
MTPSLHAGLSARRRLGVLGLMGAAALALAACDGGGGGGTGGNAGTGGTGGGAGGNGGAGGGTGGGGVEQATKVDILFSIDNSRSMADKQQILSLALDDLLTGLAAPPCLDPDGELISQPGPQEACPEGSARQYKPVTDIHIGVISSSLGGHGADACPVQVHPSNDDKAHLLDRLDPETGGTVPTYQGKGFLAWDPLQQMSPPGENNPVTLGQRFAELVVGAGQVGCGYESQLESVYRFLVDPAPYASIAVGAGGEIVKSGVDIDLLEQRKAFLRPDSLLLVLSLSDENDCSIREEGSYYYGAQIMTGGGSPFHLPKARAICATDPDNECCFSCGSTGPTDAGGNPTCAADPSCQAPGGGVAFHDDMTDHINVRCFDQKRRFGIDFLYPIDRYVDGFTSPTVPDSNGNIVPNPLFSDLDTTDSNTAIRSANLVVFAGVVGVPWQDIAKNPGDLTQGFKTAAELSQADASGNSSWDKILGDPANNVAPLDPLMVESIDQRAGSSIDRALPQRDDLQYACVMPIPEARDCTDPTKPACDCADGANDNPLCEADPTTGAMTLQTKAKAYPGSRQLQLMKGLGDQAVVGSICAGQITDPTLPDYAYRPVVSSLLDSVKGRLQ